MIEAVFVFGAMNVLFEFVLLCMLSPRIRLRLLGTPAHSNMLHVGFLVANLIIHWGTLIGTMSAIGAFLTSMLTVAASKSLFGYIKGGRYYRVGWVKYHTSQLR